MAGFRVGQKVVVVFPLPEHDRFEGSVGKVAAIAPNGRASYLSVTMQRCGTPLTMHEWELEAMPKRTTKGAK